ncbi:MAG: hypothetical protein JWO79_995 [Actinomycetia bacterium]|nr:hypothetical protein [Actinomycetes bacterium]
MTFYARHMPDSAAPEHEGQTQSADRRSAASFGRRLAALVIDCVLATLVAVAFTYPVAPRLWSGVVLFVSYTFFTGLFAQTIGMRLLRIGVVRVTDGRPIGLLRAAARTVLLQLVVPAAILDREGRGWHDRLTGSIVVSATG